MVTRDPVMTDTRYIVMTVECPECQTEQKIHVAVGSRLVQMSDQTITCIKCDNPFNVNVPDKIIRGPFPA